MSNQRADAGDASVHTSDEVQRIRRLNLNLLYPLDAILRAPTLTQAGSLIALSQPAMSLALRKLREHFNDDLIAYGNGEPRLTTLAMVLRPRVSRLLREADATWSLGTHFDPATACRTISLTAPEPIEIMYLSRVAPAMFREGAGLDVRFLPFDFASTESLFARGADVAVVPETMLDRTHRYVPLFEDGLSCLVWEDHPTIGEQMTIEQYRDARHAALSPSMERLAMMGDAMHPLTVGRRIVARTGRYSALPNLIVGTDLVVTISGWLAQYLAFHHALRIVSTPFPVQGIMLFAQWEAHRHDDPLISWAVAHLMMSRDAMFTPAVISAADRSISNSDLSR